MHSQTLLVRTCKIMSVFQQGKISFSLIFIMAPRAVWEVSQGSVPLGEDFGARQLVPPETTRHFPPGKWHLCIGKHVGKLKSLWVVNGERGWWEEWDHWVPCAKQSLNLSKYPSCCFWQSHNEKITLPWSSNKIFFGSVIAGKKKKSKQKSRILKSPEQMLWLT